MCTLTFLPKENGYYLAMNRDERIARGVGSPPERVDLAGVKAVFPRDTEGGTWIAANDRGIAFALLNWNDVANSAGKLRSRGVVIPALLTSTSNREAHATFSQLDLRGLLPFRLIGIFPEEKQADEWRWDQTSLSYTSHSWNSRNWFSSSLSDENASLQRGAACQNAWNQADAGSLPWLRRLHASHDAATGPFSICVHRESVKTLSYTEFTCTETQMLCNYFPGSPCAMAAPTSCMELRRESGLLVHE
jgi:hypothetical protein